MFGVITLKVDVFSVPCSVSMHTYAVMGVNTAFIQAALLSRARVYTVVPARMEARIDMIKGNFKLQFLPVQGIDKIASAMYVLFCSQVTYYHPFVKMSFSSVDFSFLQQCGDLRCCKKCGRPRSCQNHTNDSK